jgi:hypothetical protein
MRLRGCGYSRWILAIVFGGVFAGAGAAARPGAGLAHEFPVLFEANRGQVVGDIRYLGRARDYAILFGQTEVAVIPVGGRHILRLRFVDADPAAGPEGIEPGHGRSHYLLGRDPAGWLKDIPQFGRVRYGSLYPGVDLVFYGNQRELEFDLMLAAGARLERIRLSLEGASRMEIDPAGDLVVRMGSGQFRLHRPRAFQQTEGRQKELVARYVRLGQTQVGFAVPGYDPARPLIIDPVSSYSSLLGGASDEVAYGVAVDGTGRAYVVGYTTSLDLPATPGAYQATTRGGVRDAFVARLNALGTGFEYVTYLGGGGDDLAFGVTVDAAGNAYVAGGTSSTDFPTTTAAYRRTYNGGASDGFVAVLNAAGNALQYSTYLGGSGNDVIYGLALAGGNQATVTGETSSSNFPVTAGAWRGSYGGGLSDAFVSRLNAAGTALVFSTYLGGSADEVGYGVAVDNVGNTYVTGYTGSGNFPVTAGSVQTVKGAGYDAFVTALNATGTAPIYSTFLGGGDADFAIAAAVDGSGAAFVTGYTASSDFPRTSGVVQPVKAAGYDVFVAKLAPTGNALSYATFLGGNGDDYGLGIALDAAGNAHVTGDTASTNFPVTPDAFQRNLTGQYNAFLLKLNASGSALLYSSLFGGGGYETGYGVTLDAQGRTYVVGTTVSADFPTTAGAVQRVYQGAAEAFVLRTTTLNQTPAPAVPSPAAGSGSSRVFTFTFSDPNGWQDLNVVNVLINDFLDGRRACYLAYVRPLNVLYLVNDAGDALLPGLVLNGTGSVSNSQCTISGAGSSATGSGNTLTLTLSISFSSSFAGNRIVWLAARDARENNSGWAPTGVWNVPGQPPSSPAVGGVVPAAGSGQTQTFVFTFTDAGGWQNLGVVNVLINDYLDGRHACYLAYSRPLGVLYLVNDAGNALLPELTLGSAGSVSNSQCTVYGTGSSAVGSGNTLTLTLNMRFSSSFVGERIIYMAARDVAERNPGWQAMGRWTAP